MITITGNGLNEAEVDGAVYPKVGYVFNLREEGDCYHAKQNLSLMVNARVVNVSKDGIATIVWRDLFSKTPKINIYFYRCGALSGCLDGEFGLLPETSRQINHTEIDYWRYNRILDVFEERELNMREPVLEVA